MEPTPEQLADRPSPLRASSLWLCIEGAALLFFLHALWSFLHPPLPSVLFHGLGEGRGADASWTLPPRLLEDTLNCARGMGYRIVDGREAMAEVEHFAWSRPPLLLLSFDDGDLSLLHLALPLLERLKARATFFINTSGKKGRWSDEQIRQVHDAGWHVQSHAHTHESLARQKGERAAAQRLRVRKNLKEGRERLKALIGETPLHLAFPCGEVDAIVVEESEKLGFRYMYGCDYGYVDGSSPRSNLPRFILDETKSMEDIRAFLVHPLAWSRRQLLGALVLLALLVVRRLRRERPARRSL